jgi:SAM-dependent methyltransferase
MNEALRAEFDTVAEWTADVALDFGPDYFLPAACRGSGSPATLRWFIDRLGITTRDRMLDCGAGVGGPAAFAAEEVGAVPVLSDPEPGACRAARRLFGLPVVQAASALPFASGSIDVIWSLGVLCTVQDQASLLAEMHRVLGPSGRLGLLVFVASSLPLSGKPSGNNFPTEAGLQALLAEARLSIQHSATTAQFQAAPSHWDSCARAVVAELDRRHHGDPTWQTAAHQSEAVGNLLSGGELSGVMIIAKPD